MREQQQNSRGPISCITVTKTSRGRWIRDHHFDVPAEDYGDGNMTGYRIAAEFMAAMKAENGPGFDPLCVICDACEALGRDPGDTDGPIDMRPCRRGAAVGFLRPLLELLAWTARSGVAERYLQQTIERSLELRRLDAERQQAAKADFVRRMEIAKAAKARARRSAGKAA